MIRVYLAMVFVVDLAAFVLVIAGSQSQTRRMQAGDLGPSIVIHDVHIGTRYTTDTECEAYIRWEGLIYIKPQFECNAFSGWSWRLP